MKKLLPGMLLSVLAACDAPTIPPAGATDVYDFRLPTTPPRVLRWPSGTTVQIYVNGGSGDRAAQLLEAFRAGAAEWNRHALYAEYRLQSTDAPAAADVVLQWSDAPPVVDMTECKDVLSLAVTTFCLDTADPDRRRLHTFPLLSGAPSRVHMVITLLDTSSSDPELVRRLVAHELGHALGIARHSNDPQDLMYGGMPTRATLSARDIATLQVLYHTRPQVIP